MKPNRYQLKITLKGFNPPIWRRVIVDSDLLLEDMHSLIQTVMPWEDDHMHQFMHNKVCYCSAEDAENDYLDSVDYSETKLSDLIVSEKDNLMYQYDFGDDWMHTIVLEKILPPIESKIRAEYVTGEKACPPEDCGGVCGYVSMLELLNDSNDEEYQDMRDWLGLDDGEEFDPECVALDEKNVKKELKKI